MVVVIRQEQFCLANDGWQVMFTEPFACFLRAWEMRVDLAGDIGIPN